MVLIPCRSFQRKQQTLLLKVTKHGSVQFMYWMQDCKAMYMNKTSGNPAHMQESILDTQHFMQD